VIRIIDRYITRKFFAILLYNILAFVVIFVIVDLIENLDKFLSHHAAFGDVIVYYIYYIPFIIILTLPVCMLLSSLFSIGSMAQNNEIIAIQSSGVSLYRIIWPVLILGVVVSVLSGIGGETVVPRANRARLDLMRYRIKKETRQIKTAQNQLAVQDGKDRQIYIQFYEAAKEKAHKVNILWIKNDRIVHRLDARFMVWDKKQEQWNLLQVTERIFTDTSEVVRYHDKLAYSDSHIKPDELIDLKIKPEEMNYAELNRFVDKMIALGANARKWLVDLYMKISYPFANFIIVLFGAPLAARKRRSGPALGFALALLISFVYFLFLRTGQVLGHKGDLEPWIASWIGNIVFGVGAIILMIKVKK